jgi:hypothetical protein
MKITCLIVFAMLASCGESEQAKKEDEAKARNERIDRMLDTQREKERTAQAESVEYWKNVALKRQADERADKAEFRAMVAEINSEMSTTSDDGAIDAARQSDRLTAQHDAQMRAIEANRERMEEINRDRESEETRRRLRR